VLVINNVCYELLLLFSVVHPLCLSTPYSTVLVAYPRASSAPLGISECPALLSWAYKVCWLTFY
jgi:hypothetical protein